MDGKTIENLIRRCFESWLKQDLSLFLSTISPSIRVDECYGPIYFGTDEVRQWFIDWLTQGGKGQVTKWTRTSIVCKVIMKEKREKVDSLTKIKCGIIEMEKK